MSSECSRNIEYSEEFKAAIFAMNRERLDRPNEPDWVALATQKVEEKYRNFLPVLHRYLSLDGAKVLEMGCGTAPASVVMAEQGAEVTAIDIDPDVINAAKLRLRDHGLQDVVKVLLVRETTRLEFTDESFDLVVLNGVLEHVPPALRDSLCREMWRVLRHGGHLFIGETPNRLWPKDVHTTGLWFLHYLPTKWAAAYARRRRRIGAADDLNSLGGLGCLSWRIVRALPRVDSAILNLNKEHSWLARHKRQARQHRLYKRFPELGFLFLLEAVERLFLRPILHLPFDFLMPYLTIDIQKA